MYEWLDKLEETVSKLNGRITKIDLTEGTDLFYPHVEVIYYDTHVKK